MDSEEREEYDAWREKNFTPEENKLFYARLENDTLSDDMQQLEAKLVQPGTKFGENYAAAFTEGYSYKQRDPAKYWEDTPENVLPTSGNAYLSPNNKYLNASENMAQGSTALNDVKQSGMMRQMGQQIAQVVNNTNVTNINQGGGNPTPMVIQVGSAINKTASGLTGSR